MKKNLLEGIQETLLMEPGPSCVPEEVGKIKNPPANNKTISLLIYFSL